MPTEEATVLNREMETRVQDLAREFLHLELEQMRKGEIEARQKIERAKKEISTKRRELKSRLAEASDAPPTDFGERRDAVESAWEDLRDAVDRARRDFAGEEIEEEEEEEQGTRA